MPVKVIDIRRDIPRPSRKRKSAVEDTKEWQYVETKLRAGLKPYEGLQVILTNETLKKVKNAPRMFQKRVQRYLKELNLEYDVFQRGTTEEGTPVIWVSGRSEKVT